MENKINPMRRVQIEKITLNMGAGESSVVLEKSVKVIEKISQRKPVVTKTHKRTTFGLPKNRPIGVMITIRGKSAHELVKKLLKAVEFKLVESQFDNTGNFAFGISEYIRMQGMKYDPEIGILGLDVAVALKRPGYRVKRKKINRSVGKGHLVTKIDAIEFARKELGVTVGVKKGE